MKERDLIYFRKMIDGTIKKRLRLDVGILVMRFFIVLYKGKEKLIVLSRELILRRKRSG